jgi:hypothetical protein
MQEICRTEVATSECNEEVNLKTILAFVCGIIVGAAGVGVYAYNLKTELHAVSVSAAEDFRQTGLLIERMSKELKMCKDAGFWPKK